MKFEELNLAPELLSALTACGYTEPTPIQAQAIPHLLAGRDLIGSAQTGTGKTAAFVLPALQRLARRASAPRAGRNGVASPSVLVLAPTRELAQQVAEQAVRYGRSLRVQHGVHLRRRAVSGAEPRAGARRRHHRRDARPPHRSSRARPHRPVDARGAGARRSRPDARHGLRRRCRAHRGARSEDAPDGAVLRDLRRRDRPAVRAPVARCGAHRHRVGSRRAARDRAARALCRRPFAQASDPRSPAGRHRDHAEHRLHRDQARRRVAGAAAARAKATPPRRCTAT